MLDAFLGDLLSNQFEPTCFQDFSYRKGECFTENSSSTDQDLEIMGSKMFLHGFACLPLSNQTAGIVHFGISVQAEAKTTHLLADIW